MPRKDPKRPCPYCRKSGRLLKAPNGGAYVRCDFCAMRGPELDTSADAIDAWNSLPR